MIEKEARKKLLEKLVENGKMTLEEFDFHCKQIDKEKPRRVVSVRRKIVVIVLIVVLILMVNYYFWGGSLF